MARTTIETFETVFDGATHRHVASRFPSSTKDKTLPSERVDDSVVARVEVRQGRWLAFCPFDGCHGCEYVNFDTGLFFCCECRNRAVGSAMIRAGAPAEKTRVQVEEALLERARDVNRNWAGEPAKALRAETRAHAGEAV